MTRRFARHLALALTSLTLASCSETPTEPDAEPESLGPQANLTAAALAFRQLSGGGLHTCGVTGDNIAYCWGYNEYGQLGTGTNTGPELCHGVGSFACSTRPALVVGGHSFRQLSAGASHTCAVTTGNRVYCWGSNGIGQLGDGTTTDRVRPVAVAGGLRFRQVDAGSFHTCGVTTDDLAYCWGWNSDAQLGDFTTTTRFTPVAVARGHRFRQVSAGGNHTCGVTTSSLAYCWGDNRYGQIGDSTELPRRLRPSRVAGGRQFRQVDAGTYHSCGVTVGERAFCWGNGRDGQIGNGRTYLSFWPRAVVGGLSFERVSAGLFHTCGETTTNRAYCWGSNTFGQVGDGTENSDRLTPVTVVGGLHFTQLTVGEWHSCGKTSAGVAYCWGDDFFAQLGDGRSGFDVESSVPVPVIGPR